MTPLYHDGPHAGGQPPKLNGLAMRNIKIPEKLNPGDRIGIAAPAGFFDENEFRQGIAKLESMGYDILIPKEVHKKHGRFAGTDSNRAKTLIRLFRDTQIKGVVCARGGYGTMRTLSFLDYKTIRENPKIFMGFSDITALLVTIYDRCKMMTYHGPNVTTLEKSDLETLRSVREVFSSEIRKRMTAESGRVLRQGQARAPLVAGNLTTLCHLTGTPFELRFHGRILLIEDIDEAPYRIDRMLTHMKLAGLFQGMEGLALGSFENCGELDRIHDTVRDVFKGEGFPILSGLPVGHGALNRAFPIGLEATLDTRRHELLLHFPDP